MLYGAGGTFWLGMIARHFEHSSDMARWCLSGMEGHFLPTASISPPSLSSHIFMPGIAAFTTSLLFSIIYPSMLLLSIVTCHPQDGLIFTDLDLKLDVKDTKNRIRFSLDFLVRIYGSSLHTPINVCPLFIEVMYISLFIFLLHDGHPLKVLLKRTRGLVLTVKFLFGISTLGIFRMILLRVL